MKTMLQVMKTLPLGWNRTTVPNIYERRYTLDGIACFQPGQNNVPLQLIIIFREIRRGSINENPLAEKCNITAIGTDFSSPVRCRSNSDNGTPSQLNVSLTRQKLLSEAITVPRLWRVCLCNYQNCRSRKERHYPRAKQSL